MRRVARPSQRPNWTSDARLGATVATPGREKAAKRCSTISSVRPWGSRRGAVPSDGVDDRHRRGPLGRIAANTSPAGAPNTNTIARSQPTASMTDTMSSTMDSRSRPSVGAIASDAPVPRKSNQMCRLNADS